MFIDHYYNMYAPSGVMAAKQNPPLEKQSSVVFEALAKRLHRLEAAYRGGSVKGKKIGFKLYVTYENLILCL